MVAESSWTPWSTPYCDYILRRAVGHITMNSHYFFHSKINFTFVDQCMFLRELHAAVEIYDSNQWSSLSWNTFHLADLFLLRTLGLKVHHKSPLSSVFFLSVYLDVWCTVAPKVSTINCLEKLTKICKSNSIVNRQTDIAHSLIPF